MVLGRGVLSAAGTEKLDAFIGFPTVGSWLPKSMDQNLCSSELRNALKGWRDPTPGSEPQRTVWSFLEVARQGSRRDMLLLGEGSSQGVPPPALGSFSAMPACVVQGPPEGI